MKCNELLLAIEDYYFPMNYSSVSNSIKSCISLSDTAKDFIDFAIQSKTVSAENLNFNYVARHLNLDEASIDSMKDFKSRDDAYSKLVSLKLHFEDSYGALASTLKINESFLRNYRLIHIIKSTNDAQLAESAADKINKISIKKLAYLDVLKKDIKDENQIKRLKEKVNETAAILKKREMIGQGIRGIRVLFVSSVIAIALSRGISKFYGV